MSDHECAPLHTFHSMGKKNFVPILEEFYFSRYSGFNSLVRKLGTTPKQLSLRMSEMVIDQLLEKKEESYCITLKGKELGSLIQQIKGFHAKYNGASSPCSGIPCTDCSVFLSIKST